MATTKGKASNNLKNTKTKAEKKVPYHHQPDGMELDVWQKALRKQFVIDKKFSVKNVGQGLVFSDYLVSNPESGKTYKVAIRSSDEPINFCTCLDFRTNELGTCKHIEYVLKKINSNRRLSKLLKEGFEAEYSSVYLKYGSEKKVCLRIGKKNASRIETIASKYFNSKLELKRSRFIDFHKFVEEVGKVQKDFRFYEDVIEYVLNERNRDLNNRRVDNQLKSEPNFISSILKTSLFDFQKEGIEFALRAGRALIADDMGLGKTIQAIGTAVAMKRLYGICNVLIICPTSLKYQWKTEIEKYTDLDVSIIEGNKLKRKSLYTEPGFFKVMSYNAAVRDIEDLNATGFDLVILDEAQRIKNWQTNTAQQIKQINTDYCLVLTGTPLENKLEELYSLVQMIDPLKMGALFRFLHKHRITDGKTGKVIGYKDLHLVSELLKDVMIRRHKKNVLKQLPERMDKNLLVPMTEKQREIYDEFQYEVSILVAKWIRMKFLSEKDRQKLLIFLNQMRMVCDSTFILDQETRNDTKIEELMNIIDQVIANGNEKIVVFSQWERMTRIVASELEQRGISYRSLHGGVPSKERGDLFDDFKNMPDCRVFLSTDAGGVGLNLQSASILVNLDMPWNPAVLEQRIARIHRMGQKRKIQVINLISAGTIEQEMLNKLKFKSSMAEGVLDNGESTIFLKESKFNSMMKEVAEMIGTGANPQVIESEDLKYEQSSEISGALVKEEFATKEENSDFNVGQYQTKEKSTNDVLKKGLDFFSSLATALSTEEGVEQLVSSIVKTDSSTGETYLQIPVKDKDMVQNGIMLIKSLLSGLK